MSVRKWPVVGVVLAVLWVFVRGATPDALVGEFLIGLAVGFPIAFVFRRFYTDETAVVRNLRAAPYALLYVAVFLKELLTANIDVAYRVLAPGMPIRPGVVVVPLRVQTDGAVTTIANSITLTPGTLTMDYDEERNALYVHSIVAHDHEAILDPIRTWEDYALVVFDEEKKPGDPVPTLPTTEGATTAAEERREPGEASERSEPSRRRPDGGDADGD